MASQKLPDLCERTEIDGSSVRAHRFRLGPGIHSKCYTLGLYVKNVTSERNAGTHLALEELF